MSASGRRGALVLMAVLAPLPMPVLHVAAFDEASFLIGDSYSGCSTCREVTGMASGFALLLGSVRVYVCGTIDGCG